MSAPWLEGIRINASHGDCRRWATRPQVGAIAGILGKRIREYTALGPDRARELRMELLNELFGELRTLRGRGEISSASQLTFGEARALLDWLHEDGSTEELWGWVDEQVDDHALLLITRE